MKSHPKQNKNDIQLQNYEEKKKDKYLNDNMATDMIKEAIEKIKIESRLTPKLSSIEENLQMNI